jgi:hypothetical protein
MPTRPYLPGKVFDPETISEMSNAIQSVCAANIVRPPELSADPSAERKARHE